MAAGSPQKEAKSDNYLAAFKSSDFKLITHTKVHFRERLHAHESTKGQSEIQVNQVVAVAVKMLYHFTHGHNRLVCNNCEL